MFDLKDLLKQQLEQITAKRRVKAVKLSAATGVSYNAKLQRLVRDIKEDIDRELIPLIRDFEREYVGDRWAETLSGALEKIKEKWSSHFIKSLAISIATDFVDESERINRKRFNESMQSFGFDIYGDSIGVDDLLKLAAHDNARLIKSIPEQYLSEVESVVLSNIRSGSRAEKITSLLRDKFQITKSRAKLIARDQTARINSNLTKQRQQSSGFEYFEWVDVDDERVRHRHSSISRRKTKYGTGIYRWDDLPKSEKGQPIAPGDDFQCRCFARPVLASEVERNQ